MNSMEERVIKSGFSAVNENLTDIAKSLRKLITKEEEHWRTVKVDGLPGPEYEWVVAIISYKGVIDDVPIIARFDQKEFFWIVHFADGYLDQQLDSDCEVVRWLPIFDDSGYSLYANGKEVGRRQHRYGE